MEISQSSINIADKKSFFDNIFKNREVYYQKNAYYYNLITQYLKFIIPSESSILDLGCYTGDRLAKLSARRAVGIDFSPKTVKEASKKHPHICFISSDMDVLDISETFDYVIVGHIIGYVDNLQKTFRAIRKICRPDTKVIFIYHSHLWRPLFKLAEILGWRMKWPQQHWLAKRDLMNLLYLENFTIIRSAQQALLPFYIPILSEFFNKFLVHLPGIRHLALDHLLIVQPNGIRMAEDQVNVSVIVPCRNEKGNIEQAVARMPRMGKKMEIIFVEGHSKDGTLGECQRVKEKYSEVDITVIQQKGIGKGDAVREGFSAAKGDVLMILDADLTVPPENLTDFYEALVSGKGEFINGSRLVYKMENQAMQFLNMIANKLFSIVLTHLLGQYLKDTLCGTKVLWKEDYKKIEKGRSYFGDFDPFGDFDLLFGAAKLNLKIVEIPVQYRARTYGQTQISRFKHGWMLLKMTVFAAAKIKYV